MKIKTLLFISLLAFSILSLMSVAAYFSKDVYADTEEVASNNWETPLLVSGTAAFAERPNIAAAPNGKTVLVTYIGRSSGEMENSPFYSYSTNNGKAGSWTFHRRIYAGSTVKSEQVQIIFDNNNKAHAVWIEGGGLAYANSSNLSGGFNAPKLFTEDLINSDLVNVRIATFGNYVHIVGAVSDGNSNSNIFYVQSSNGGTSWGTPIRVTNNDLQTDRPAITTDNVGNLHLVYRQQRVVGAVIDLAHFHLKYARGAFNGSAVTWNNETAHVDITGTLLNGTSSMVEPSIMFANGRLEVSATHKFDSPNPNNDALAQQYVVRIHCGGSCTVAANWSQHSVSGLALYINNDPYNLVSDIVQVGNCINIVFDGKISTTLNPAEQIFSNNSCSSWVNTRNNLTDPTVARSIQPAAATQNNWWMYVVYEEFADGIHKIYFTRNIPGVYLPIIRK